MQIFSLIEMLTLSDMHKIFCDMSKHICNPMAWALKNGRSHMVSAAKVNLIYPHCVWLLKEYVQQVQTTT